MMIPNHRLMKVEEALWVFCTLRTDLTMPRQAAAITQHTQTPTHGKLKGGIDPSEGWISDDLYAPGGWLLLERGQADTQALLAKRTRDACLVLQGHDTNIPTVAFCNTGKRAILQLSVQLPRYSTQSRY